MTAKNRILIVDDEPEILAEMTEHFIYKGYNVTTAENGDEALAKFRAEPCDAVITDIKMAGGSGTELVNQLRAIDPILPVILITGHYSAADLEEGQGVGATIALKKPVKLRELDALVAKLLKRAGEAEPSVAPASRRRHGPEEHGG